MNVSARGSLMWEEAGEPRENPCVLAGRHLTQSHTTNFDLRDRTWVVVVRVLSTALLDIYHLDKVTMIPMDPGGHSLYTNFPPPDSQNPRSDDHIL